MSSTEETQEDGQKKRSTERPQFSSRIGIFILTRMSQTYSSERTMALYVVLQ